MTCISRLQNFLPEKRGFSVERCESLGTNMCLFDNDRILDPTVAPEVSESDVITEDEPDIPMIASRTLDFRCC